MSIILLSINLPAQLYKTTLGIRLDNEQFGIGIDQRIFKPVTVSAAFDARSNEVRATALLRYHIKVIGRRLNVYPGIGAHAGVYKNYGSYQGGDLLFGAEYKMLIAPIVISFDFMPSFHTGGEHPDWWNLQSVFSIKYVIQKRKGLFERLRDHDKIRD